MDERITSSNIAGRLWLYSWLVPGAVVCVITISSCGLESFEVAFVVAISSCIASLPAFLILLLTIEIVQRLKLSLKGKLIALCLLLLSIALLYGVGIYALFSSGFQDGITMEMFGIIFGVTAILFCCAIVSAALNYKNIRLYLMQNEPVLPTEDFDNQTIIFNNKTNIHMEQHAMASLPETQTSSSNKILIKGIITGVLILAMLIPTIFISNLVYEREQRQKEVVAEVSSKWARPQTVTGPYMVIPYNETSFDEKKKPVVVRKQVFILPETMNVQANVLPEKRLRSIYTVLLYRSKVDATGSFKPVFPSEITIDNLLLNEARLCIGINDFKGIEEKVNINFNGKAYDLTPGLPTTAIDSAGLSCSASLTREDLSKQLPFTFNLKIKGSEQLHFVPLAGNSSFVVKSTWSSPSFDGTSLPTERNVNDNGFSAKWNFNKANLPFNTVSNELHFDKATYAFGVSMLQPADQYAKTSRSVKYAILFIGLTFSLFFIIELLQKKPVHPVQYVLVGLALIIFYSLLLSLSEFLLFNNAYLIASVATVSLISLYAKGHFASWKIAGLFALVLGSLYGFIFVLIQLEDTALLVGSIGLFGVIALVMYASRKINWYNPSLSKTEIA